MSFYVTSNSMDTKSVSKDFFNACVMIHDMVDEFYEELHDSNGNPMMNEELIADLIKTLKNKMRLELISPERLEFHHTASLARVN